MNKIEKRLHLLALVAVRKDLVDLLDYLVELNHSYYDIEIHLSELYFEAMNHSSLNTINYLENKFSNNNKVLELK